MRLSFPDRKSAQAAADRIYADMMADGKLEPNTTAWPIPFQGLDEKGNPIGTDWFIVIDSRCASFMKDEEVAKVPELTTSRTP